MPFLSRLVIFAVGLTVVLAGWRVVERVRRPEPRTQIVHIDMADAMASPAPVAPVAPVAPLEAAEVRIVELPVGEPAPAMAAEAHIVTRNRSAFMALRDDRIVAGLTDSLRKAIRAEMEREIAKEKVDGMGVRIAQTVVNGIGRILDKQVEVPLSKVRDIRYDGTRIVLEYRGGKPDGFLTLETIKSDNDRTLLEQFSEADARRFVRVVKERIR